MGIEKAIVAALVAALATFVADQGWNIDEGTLTDIVQSIVGGLVTGAAVYMKRNSNVTNSPQ